MVSSVRNKLKKEISKKLTKGLNAQTLFNSFLPIEGSIDLKIKSIDIKGEKWTVIMFRQHPIKQ